MIADPARISAHPRHSFSPQFTDATAACVVLSERTCAALPTRPFTAWDTCDATRSTAVPARPSRGTRPRVDERVVGAVAAGGAAHPEPEDHGAMSGHGSTDPDGPSGRSRG